MKWMAITVSYLFVFVLGIRFAEWSAREDHATMINAGRFIRHLVVPDHPTPSPSGREGGDV